MGKAITKHNKLLFQIFEQTIQIFNSRDKAICPMEGNCLQKCFVCQAREDSANSSRYYLRMSEDDFKTRYNNHTMSFPNKGYKKDTELSRCLEIERERRRFYQQMVCCLKSFPYICSSKHCDLSLKKKLVIAMADPRTLLNKLSKTVSKCRHCNKFTLKRFFILLHETFNIKNKTNIVFCLFF